MHVVRSLLIVAGVIAPLAAGLAMAGATQQSPAAMAMPTSAQDNDAAAKHAKRTACLKEAKAKKLVGAQRTAFIKECMAKP